MINPGFATTVQDRGRPGYRGFGVPVGGAFDLDSLGLANALLSNDRDDAAIELTMVGGLLPGDAAAWLLALAGAPFWKSHVDLRRIRLPQSFTLEEGEELRIGGTARGASRRIRRVRGGFSETAAHPWQPFVWKCG